MEDQDRSGNAVPHPDVDRRAHPPGPCHHAAWSIRAVDVIGVVEARPLLVTGLRAYPQ